MTQFPAGIKKDLNRIGLVLLGNQAILFAVVALFYSEELEGGISILSAVLGIAAIFIYRRNQLFSHDLTASGKKMTRRHFTYLFIICLSIQFVFSYVWSFAEFILNHFGYTSMKILEALTPSSWSMSLYIALIAPLTEEIIFRGAILRSLERYGKAFAIFTSALLFGLYHGDLFQGFFAFCFGLLLGYTAVTYSFSYALLFHILNNSLALAFTWLAQWSEALEASLYLLLYGLACVAAAFLVLKNKKGLTARYRQLKDAGTANQLLPVLTNFWLLVFIIFNLCIALQNITHI